MLTNLFILVNLWLAFVQINSDSDGYYKSQGFDAKPSGISSTGGDSSNKHTKVALAKEAFSLRARKGTQSVHENKDTDPQDADADDDFDKVLTQVTISPN